MDALVCLPILVLLRTQADIDTGFSSDRATVVSLSPVPSALEIVDEASCTTPLPRKPGVEILKDVTDVTAASGFHPSVADAGDTIDYRITVTNTGNTWLSDVTVSDPMFGDGLDCSNSYIGNSSRFSPGAKFECTAKLTLEQVHVDGRCVGSTANVSCVQAGIRFNPVGDPVETSYMPPSVDFHNSSC